MDKDPGAADPLIPAVDPEQQTGVSASSRSVNVPVLKPPPPPPPRPTSRAWLYAGLTTDFVLLVTAGIMLSSTMGNHHRAGGSYAWSQSLLLMAGIVLFVVAFAGIVGSIRPVIYSETASNAARKIFLAQIVIVVVLCVLEVLSLIMFFSFFGKLSNAPSSEIDTKFPIFSNFANCSWNACCRRTHVRERSYEKLVCNSASTGFSKDERSLSKLCANMPHEAANASKCVMGNGLIEWRQDLSSWIFREIMSWSWIVFTVIVLEFVAVAMYSCRWNAVREGDTGKKVVSSGGGPVNRDSLAMKIQ